MPEQLTKPATAAWLTVTTLCAFSAAYFSLPRIFNEWAKNADSEFIFFVFILSTIFFLKSSNEPSSPEIPLQDGKSTVNLTDRLIAAALIMISLSCLFADAALEEESLLFFALWTGLLGINSINPYPGLKQRLWFPLILLIFCLPVPQYVAFYHFHYPMQRLSTLWTAGMLDLAGIAATVSGTLVNIGQQSMHIAEECSGIKFLAILLLFVTVAGQLFLKHSISRKIMLLCAAVPVAIMTNIIRLTAAGMIMTEKGEKTAMAFLHGNSVLIFYAAAVFLLAALTRLAASKEILSPDDAAQYQFSGNSSQSCCTTKSGSQSRDFCANQPELKKQMLVQNSQIHSDKPENLIYQQTRQAGFFMLIILWSIFIALTGSLATARQDPIFHRDGLEKLQFTPAGWNSSESYEGSIKAYTPGFASAKQNRQLILSAPSGRRYTLEIAWWPQRRPRNRLIVFHQAVICSMGVYAGGIHSEMQIGDQELSYSLISENRHQKSFFYWLQSENQISTRPYFHALWQYRRELFRQPSDGCFVLIAADGKIKDTSSLELKTLIKHTRETLQNWLSQNK